MPEYIEREATYKALEEADSTFNISMGAFNFLSQLLSEIPAADVRPVVCGEWLHPIMFPDDLTGHMYGECSNCGKLRIVDNFCPNCGADMREET